MKIRRINEDVDLDIKIKNYFTFIYELPPAKQMECVEFLKSLNLTDEQYGKLADIIHKYGSDQYSEGLNSGWGDPPVHFEVY